MRNIQILSAPSILGLQSNGVEKLGESLLSNGLREKLKSENQVITTPTFNELRSPKRSATGMLNEEALEKFSRVMYTTIKGLESGKFPLVLGGDCSIIVGIMAALKSKGNYGLIFLDAHADFYLPEESTTGEAADMDLALVTGRGPVSLTDLHNLKPYIKDEHVFHIGQRDEAEADEHGSQRIQDTAIHCFNYEVIKQQDAGQIADAVVNKARSLNLDGYWIHFDTDVLSDNLNPAVDYRLPGGLSFEQCEVLLQKFLTSLTIIGLDVTIFNPLLDKDGTISMNLTTCLGHAFN